MEILTNTEYDFNIWYNTKDPKFYDISLRSFLPYKWVAKSGIDISFNNSVIKPINRYVQELYPKPELVSIDGNTITLRQKTHAEISLLETIDGFRNIDRPHMRQYYNTSIEMSEVEDCFSGTYVFYSPWVVDENIEAKFIGVDGSPFLLLDSEHKFSKTDQSSEFIEPKFIPFKFKRVGSHMVNDKFGKIRIGSPMFDIILEANDLLIEKIRKEYE